VKWLAKDDALGQALFITELFGIRGVADFTCPRICTTPVAALPELRNGTGCS
jgi:hypothetical protein